MLPAGLGDMRFSLGVTTSMSLKEGTELARLAEKNGYHRVWVGEDIPRREVFSYLSVLALKTRQIQLGTGITSVMVRNLAVMANSAAGLQWLSKGRFALGLGVGGIPEVTKFVGRKPDRAVARMREATQLLRRALCGEKINHKGEFAYLHGYKPAYRVTLPKIYFGVRGEKLLSLAGEIADGVIFSGPIERLVESMKIVEESAEEAGRDPKDVDRVLWNAFVMIQGPGDLDLARGAAHVMKKSMKDYAGGVSGVEALKQLSVHGTKKEILKKIEEYESLGFQELVVGPPYGRNPRKVIAAFGGG